VRGKTRIVDRKQDGVQENIGEADQGCRTTLRRCGICGVGLPRLALTSADLGLGTVGLALLFGALEVATLLSELVAIVLTPQAVEGKGRACTLEAACSVEGAAVSKLSSEGGLGACSRVHGIVGVEQSFQGGDILGLCTSVAISDSWKPGERPRRMTFP
jgi:hypothetical protein